MSGAAAAKRRHEDRARAVHSQVGVVHWEELQRLLQNGDIAHANELLEGLSLRDFNYVYETAEGQLGPLNRRPAARYSEGDKMRIPDMAQRILKRHQDTREEHREVARLVFESSGVSARLRERLDAPMSALIGSSNVLARPMMPNRIRSMEEDEAPPDSVLARPMMPNWVEEEHRPVRYAARPAPAAAALARPDSEATAEARQGMGFRMRY